jgi:hypothetical protein
MYQRLDIIVLLILSPWEDYTSKRKIVSDDFTYIVALGIFQEFGLRIQPDSRRTKGRY